MTNIRNAGSLGTVAISFQNAAPTFSSCHGGVLTLSNPGTDATTNSNVLITNNHPPTADDYISDISAFLKVCACVGV